MSQVCRGKKGGKYESNQTYFYCRGHFNSIRLAIRLIIVFTKEMKNCLTGVNVIKNMNPSDITLVNVAFQEMKHSRVMGSGIAS